MVFVDSNAFVVLIIGLMDVNWLKHHKKTSIYEAEDFDNLIQSIGSVENIITTPNILTEVDNLLNSFSGHQKYPYIKAITDVIRKSNEVCISSLDVIDHYYFPELGITDSVVLHLSNQYDLLVTADSSLSDYAISLGIRVLDLVAYRNSRL